MKLEKDIHLIPSENGIFWLRFGKLDYLPNAHVMNAKGHHLHITSEDTIYEGSHVIHDGKLKRVKELFEGDKGPNLQVVFFNEETNGYLLDCQKVIASSDDSINFQRVINLIKNPPVLSEREKELQEYAMESRLHEVRMGTTKPREIGVLPMLPETLLVYYTEEYNKKNILDKILVEYDRTFASHDSALDASYTDTLKLVNDYYIDWVVYQQKQYTTNQVLLMIQNALFVKENVFHPIEDLKEFLV